MSGRTRGAAHGIEDYPPASTWIDDPRPPELGTDFTGDGLPEVRLDPEVFQRLVEARGVRCIYRPAVLCPCQRIETGTARLGCPACRGFGIAYPEELEEPTIAIVQRRSSRRTMAPPGGMVSGTVQITFSAGIVPGLGDMLIPDGDRHVVQEVLRVAENQVDVRQVRARAESSLQNPPASRPATARLLYPDVLQLLACHWLDPASRTLRAGRLGVHFGLADDGVITFRPGHGPAPGEAFSVRYLARAAYVMLPADPVQRTGEEGFPYACEGQRLDKHSTRDLR